MTVLVVGGGITGLTAARDLGRAGIATVLAEASTVLGGKTATEHAGDMLIELGPDSFLTTRPAAVELATELGLGDRLLSVIEPRTVFILRDGKRIPMPEGLGLVLPTRVRPFVTTPLFTWPEKARMALDLALPRAAGTNDMPVGRFLRRRLGQPLVDRLAGPLVGGIYGTSIEELSLDAVVPTLREAERAHRSLLLAGLADGRRMRAARANPGAGTAHRRARPLGIFASLTGGVGELVDALRRSAIDTGSVEVRLDSPVESLTSSATGVRATLSGGRVLRADAVIVATPGPSAARLLEPSAPEAARAVAAIPHGSSTVVTLAWRRDMIPPMPAGHGILVPRNEGLPISALTFSSQKWPGRAPDDIFMLRAFLPDEPLPGHGEVDLIAAARHAVGKVLGVVTEPELARVSTYVANMPRYTVGHLERVERAEAALARTRIHLAGAPYHGVGLPDCVSAGREAAARVARGIGEHWERCQSA